MIVDLHNHTKFCNHAEGKMFEYIEKAININTSYFGFSDHAPMHFDPKYRMTFEQMQIYEQSVKAVKKAYQDKITILLGYEVDYLQGYIDKRVLNADIDYLIGSVHFINQWGFDNPEFIGGYQHQDIDKIWQDYFDLIEAMAKTNLFHIAGHIDLIKVFKFLPKKDVRLIAENAVKAIKKANMSVEINAAGFRKPIGEAYPSDAVMELLVQHDVDITFGSDAHKPEQVGYMSKEVEELAKRYGYTQCAVYIQQDRELIKF